MTLGEILDAIVAVFQANISALKSCESHGGRFDAQELMRVAARSPALFVSIVDLADIQRKHGEWEAIVTFGAFTVAKDTPSQSRALMGLALVEAIARIIPQNDWGLQEAIEVPSNISSKNLYSGALDKKGVSLWGTTWRQKFSLGAVEDVSTLNDFLLLHAVHDLDTTQDGEPQAEDNIELSQEE